MGNSTESPLRNDIKRSGSSLEFCACSVKHGNLVERDCSAQEREHNKARKNVWLALNNYNSKNLHIHLNYQKLC